MRFSIVAGPRHRWDLGQSAYEAQRDFVEDAVLSEELGFDAAYFGEHHFCFASGNSSPLTLLAAVAARTKRIRVGTSIICAPFHNPLRLAEDIASVDMISNGRFDFGVGVGSQLEEFRTFDIDPKTRFGRTWEVIDIVERCLYGGTEEFDWKGKYYNFPGVRWIMQPVQKRIPILWGGFGPQGVQRAAERGYHLIAPDVTGTYQRVMSARGADYRKQLIGFVTVVSIADSKEEAIQAMAEPCTWVSNQYSMRPDLDGIYPPESHRFNVEDIVERARAGRIADFMPSADGKPAPFSVPLAGTVSEVRDFLLRAVRGERGFLTHFCFGVREPGTATPHVQRTMRLLSTEVLPALREEAAKLDL
jgi:alkanesulfonate monooxygenase SsuD/methylene tetrahydromethanopterin reductase-like flavin-dependent oxidoreductase (luciferase family)